MNDAAKEHPDAERALELLQRHARLVDEHLQSLLSARSQMPRRLFEAIQYSLLAGGKRLRPALVLESFRACEGRDEKSALASASAMELIHTFSLVHDDLPAMDNDDLRRGRPTNHKVFGEAMAILAGDGMVTLAFEIIASEASAQVGPNLVRELAHAAGPQGMIGGQVLDIEAENTTLTLEQLQRVHRMKTGALLKASCRMGAIAAAASEQKLAALTDYGRNLGLAFQIVDDLLDVTATPQQLGKATNKDAGAGKNTYPSLLGVEKSKAAAEKALADGLKALQSFGPEADGLRDLARFIVSRSF